MGASLVNPYNSMTKLIKEFNVATVFK